MILTSRSPRTAWRPPAVTLGFFTGICLSLANALAFSLFARWLSADHATDSKGYVAHKGNLMADDDVMIVDCGATKHCIPDASKLSKVTDRNPRHAVKVGDGNRLDVSVIGEMQTKVNTVTPVTRKCEVSMRHAVETMHLTHVLVVPVIWRAASSAAHQPSRTTASRHT